MVELGKILKNKTWSFLMPCLKGHGKIFTNKITNDVFKLGVGILDTSLENSYLLEDKRPIFILCDSAVNRKNFESFLDWVKYQDYFIANYTFDSKCPRKQMIVLNVPEKYNKAYDKFLVGLYSEMYSQEDLEVLITDKESVAYKVLSKDSTYRDFFISKVEKEFKTFIDDKSSFKDSELEFPYYLNKGIEIFNYEE